MGGHIDIQPTAVQGSYHHHACKQPDINLMPVRWVPDYQLTSFLTYLKLNNRSNTNVAISTVKKCQ